MKNLINTLVLISVTLTLLGQSEVELRSDGIVVPKISNTERPISPMLGHLVFNTDQGQFEYYDGTSWIAMYGGGATDRIVDGNANVIVDEGGLFFPDRISMRLKDVVAAQFIKNTSGHVGLELNDPGDNVVIGNSAAINMTGSGGQNVIVGKFSGIAVNTGVRNVFNGYQSGNKNEEGSDNVAVGHNALQTNVTARANIAIGTDALKNLNTDNVSSPFGSDNVAIGYKSMENVGAGSTGNVAIGYEAGNDNTVDSKNVFLGYNAGKGASKLDNALYINNEAGDNPLIFGDFINNKVGINNNGSNLTDALNVDGASGQGALRVRVAGTTRLRVHSNGGVSIGENSTPVDTGGLKVHALRGVGSQPAYADSGGNLTRKSGDLFRIFPAMEFRADDWSSAETFSDYNSLDLPPIFSPVIAPPSLLVLLSLPLYYTQIDLPHGALFSRLEFKYKDDCSTCEFHLWIYRVSINDPSEPWEDDDIEEIGHFNTSYSSALATTRTNHINLTEVIDTEHFYYLIRVGNAALPLNPRVQFYNAKATYSY